MLGIAALVLATDLAPRRRRGPETAPSTGRSVPRRIRFNRDIRPILSDKCFQCHGPDATQAQGETAARQREGATAPAASGSPAIVPGKLDESELYRRVSSTDLDEQMPPPKTGKPLTAAEIQKLKTWIEEGAEYEAHWAFIPPVRPELPQVHHEQWVRNPIDAFVLARLEKEGLSPAAEADRATLIRRLNLDLIGLPPTIQEVDAFLADRRGDSFDRLVQRLLDSPHHGERWARIWLDAARYADSRRLREG